MTTTSRDFTAEYIAARENARRKGATIADRSAAQKRSAAIARAAAKAGVKLDEIALDEQARQNLYG